MSLSIYSINAQGLKNTSNRYNLIKFINGMRPSIVCIQETNINTISDSKLIIPNYLSYYNSAAALGSGTVIFTSQNIKVLNSDIVTPGKVQYLTFKLPNCNPITMFNVHLSHNNKEALNMINSIENVIRNIGIHDFVLAGDWNYVDNPVLDKKNCMTERKMVRTRMKSLLENSGLIDTFRYLYPEAKIYTHTGYNLNRPESRLDRIYVSGSLVPNIQKASILPSFSDHRIVNSCFSFSNGGRSAYWKFDNHLLKLDYFKEQVEDIMMDFINSPNKSFSKYELLKFKIKQLSMEFRMKEVIRVQTHVDTISKTVHKHSADNYSLFQELISVQNRGILSNILNPDTQLLKIPNFFSELTIDRAMEDRTRSEKTQIITEFFMKAFGRVRVEDPEGTDFLNDLPCLSECEAERLEEEVTIPEIIKGIDQMGKGKCPGLDGLTAEFFQAFSGSMSKILLWLWNEICDKGVMPRSLRTGITTLIYKKGDALDLNNWRPVTMSNIDYKVFAHVFKNRILDLLPKLIGPYQTCNVPGRSIFDNLHFIRDNVEMNGAILSIDQAGAFNNVDHLYLTSVLKAYGFPEFFCKSIKIMYDEIRILVNVGGDLVGPIPYQKGVKQGDPMASLLYILALEPLLRRLHTGMRAISPSPFPRSPDTNISCYADDTNLFISHVDQFPLIDSELANFSKYSGGRINVNKTNLYLCGDWEKICHRTPYTANSYGIKILGIWFGKAICRNWEDLLTKYRQKLDIYSARSTATTFHSKAQVLNRYLLPILWYVLKVLDPPADFITSIRRLSEEYLWGPRKHWVKRLFVYAPQQLAGLGIKHPDVQILTMRMRDTIRVFTSSQNLYFLNGYVQSVRSVVMLNQPTSIPFYENMRRKYNIIRFRFKTITSELLGDLGVKNVSVFPGLRNEEFLELGLTTVDSVLNWNGDTGILSSARKRKLEANQKIFREQLQEIQEFQVEDSKALEFTCENPAMDIGKITNRNLYPAAFFGIFQPDQISNGELNKMRGDKWSNIVKSQISNPEKDVTWRLRHNSLLTFSLASRMGLYTSDDCHYCNVRKPNSFHIIHCVSTKNFWEMIWKLITNMGISASMGTKLNGFSKSGLGNIIVFLAHSVLYNRILYTINSGKADYDLISIFKQRLSERLLLEYNLSNSSKAELLLFKMRWNGGLGR